MPHFGLMEEATMSKEAAALLRARLHLRGGRRRLRQGKTAAGLAALYDALGSGMQWYILRARDASLMSLKLMVDRYADHELFSALALAGILDDTPAFRQLESLLDQLLKGQTPGFDQPRVVTVIEHWLTLLGVMPFDEETLPCEDPETF